jgi:NADPH:quinone reductase-like Zn-dependent oxidoreductase
MRAAVLVKNGDAKEAFEIQEVPKPVVSELEILIEVEAFGLNFADVMARHGLYKDAPPMPSILGYDVVGKVVEAASDEAQHLVGKRVVAMTRFGGYAEFAKTDYRACAVISDSINAAEATALATQYCTAYYAAYECASLFEGDQVLIHACAGGVGTALTQLAKHKGCTVYGTSGSDAKFDYLRNNGVDYPINYRKEDYSKKLLELSKGKKLDVAFNSVGGTTFKKDMKLLDKGGKSVIYGAAERSGKKGGAFATLGLVWNFGLMTPIQLLMNSQGVIGINMLRIADHKPMVMKRCLEAVVDMTEKKILTPSAGGVFSINEIGEAHAFLEGRTSTGKIAIMWK